MSALYNLRLNTVNKKKIQQNNVSLLHRLRQYFRSRLARSAILTKIMYLK